MKKNKYKVAKYMRLSRDDGDDRESESIENQRDIIDSYITEHEDLEVVGEYADDGFTGTNFNRPGFQKMLNDIEEGKIDCIITKDLSRFGRDHIDTGYYLERYFPANAIRYIAIGDNVDTLRADGLQFLTFKLSFNDYYAQDISNKIKSVKNRKIEKGEFQGGIAPYGYKKDEKIKNHLVIDEYAANVVRSIFDMYINKGMSTTKIADELNRKEILAPAEYLKIPIYMQRKSKNPDTKYFWLRAQIGKILKNEVYIGNVVGRKYQKVSHKIAKVRMTKEEEHVVVENMHEPIIDLDTWEKTQEKLKSKVITRERKYDHPLKGLVFCRECGKIATLRCRTETRKSGAVWRADYFICSNRNSYTGLCDCKQIQAKIIEDEIKKVLKQEIQKLTYSKDELKKIYKESQIEVKEEKNKLDRKLKKYNEKLNSANSMLKDLYEDKTNKIITLDDFEMFYKETIQEKEEYMEKIKQLQTEIIQINKKIDNVDIDKIEKQAKEVLSLENITKEMYQKLIEKIEFDKEKNIYIKFKFSKYIDT